MGGTSRAVCLFWCPTASAFGADLEDVSSEVLLAPKGEPPGGIASLRSRQKGGDVSSCLPVLVLSTSSAFGADLED
eukprot:8664459-Pyramimonas_sp.AAC.1